ncbi:hypothetical protein CIHG_09852 [Coccidioides immitis H538.4]|uniref:Uncharacterized protein n=3 Tax=Coccidioides immitis TaxID=5501 RepID=A0A0J8QYS7_COCIT|nr:hypothetical protein CIRG_02500 [Coccidioides immitis RMSCC 2394]KMU77195.1 hypothetical protein CISG_06039 [Coccidioides immitis RMSCC 3703]KMU92098.1 hypothetical protein CIHG_09852 [Coccidioides immitis H538.4]
MAVLGEIVIRVFIARRKSRVELRASNIIMCLRYLFLFQRNDGHPLTGGFKPVIISAGSEICRYRAQNWPPRRKFECIYASAEIFSLVHSQPTVLASYASIRAYRKGPKPHSGYRESTHLVWKSV